METQTHSESQLPVAAVVINHEVEDYAAWKRTFDRHAASRQTAGIIAAHVNRHAEHPNQLSVYLAGSDRAKLAAFLTSHPMKRIATSHPMKRTIP